MVGRLESVSNRRFCFCVIASEYNERGNQQARRIPSEHSKRLIASLTLAMTRGISSC
ncbi:MAG: hypothetical protein K2N54_04325 [Helicobacter sp.]|nr:hypothetical protein [Helicobacter sp.]